MAEVSKRAVMPAENGLNQFPPIDWEHENLYLMNDFLGRATDVPESWVEAWSKAQKELKEKFDKGEIPDPRILTQEDKDLIASIFGPAAVE